MSIEPTRPNSFRTIRIPTERGGVICRFYPCQPPTERAVIWVGGIGGGFDSPARDLYPDLAETLRDDGIASLRVRLQNPGDLFTSVMDVLAGIGFLSQQGYRFVALVGHSFGGAVVIQAAAQSRLVKTVITLATQSFGTDAVRHFLPDCSLLLVHGERDAILSPRSSHYVYDRARQPKSLVIYPDTGHLLEEASDSLRSLIGAWIRKELIGVDGQRKSA